MPFGDRALFANTTGLLNVAVGFSALGGNTSGNNNIGIGSFGGFSITTANNVMSSVPLVPPLVLARSITLAIWAASTISKLTPWPSPLCPSMPMES